MIAMTVCIAVGTVCVIGYVLGNGPTHVWEWVLEWNAWEWKAQVFGNMGLGMESDY